MPRVGQHVFLSLDEGRFQKTTQQIWNHLTIDKFKDKVKGW